MLELYIEYEPEYVQSSLLFKEGDDVWLFGSVSNRTPGLVALQEALNDWNAKQAYIAQYAAQAQEDAPPAPPLYLPGDRVVSVGVYTLNTALAGELGTVMTPHSDTGEGWYYVHWDTEDTAVKIPDYYFKPLQEAAQPAPDLSLQARIEDDIRHGKKMDFLKKYYQEEDTND